MAKRIGKVNPDFLLTNILGNLGKKSSEVIVKPAIGVDFGAVDLEGGNILVVSTDPVYVPREFGLKWGMWFGLQILVADVLVSGIPPQYMVISLQLPPDLPDEDLRALWDVINSECERMGITILAGHTGRYEGCHFPTIGSATVLGIGPRERLITPDSIKVGDQILVTTGLGVESAISLDYCEHGTPDILGDERLSILPEIQILSNLGKKTLGITALHDAAEGGVLGAVFELLRGQDKSASIDSTGQINPPEIERILMRFGLDPWSSSSQGTLLITCRPHGTPAIIGELTSQGLFCAKIGTIKTGPPRVEFKRPNNSVEILDHPPKDRFWEVFSDLNRK